MEPSYLCVLSFSKDVVVRMQVDPKTRKVTITQDRNDLFRLETEAPLWAVNFLFYDQNTSDTSVSTM